MVTVFDRMARWEFTGTMFKESLLEKNRTEIEGLGVHLLLRGM